MDLENKRYKNEKKKCQSDPHHFLNHIDLAENWNIIMKNPVQENHWVKWQVSIFTAVFHQVLL